MRPAEGAAPVILPGHEALPGSWLMAGPNDPVKIGEWAVDPRDDSLARPGEKLKLEPRTMRLLMRLAQTPGAVVSQDELLDSVWSGVVVSPASIYQSMSQLRKVLGDVEDPPRYIETVARKGYRLIAPVSPADPAPAPPAETASDPAASTAEPKSRWRWFALGTAAVLLVVPAVWRLVPHTPPTPEFASIVVLPFVDLTSGGTEQPFCDGLTEELSNWLAQIPTLHVVARTSAFSFRKRDADARTIGRELATSHLLEGSLRRSGNTMRITVQLIDTRTGYHLWSSGYDVEAGDVLKVQEEVARSVASNLELRMTAETDSRFAGRRSRSADAQRLYLIARAHAAKFDASSNEQAITLYRQALEADPGFALAKVWLAHAIANQRYFSNQPIEVLAKDIEPLLADVEKSTPQLADLYVVRGAFRLELRQREAALADLKRALEMNPNSRSAASTLGLYHLTAGEPRDALTYYTMASAIDPRDFGLHASRCIALADLAQFVAAEAACERARSLDPESPYVYSVLSAMEASRGKLDAALKWSDAALKRDNNIAEMHAERARWLLSLGLADEAGKAYLRSVAANAEAARRNFSLTLVGAASAIDAGGAKALHAFIKSNGLDESTNPKLLFELANAALMAGDNELARRYVDRALASPTLEPEDLASPWLARTGQSYLLVTAATLRVSGDATDAGKRLDELAALLARMTSAGVQTAGVFELQAQLLAMRGEGDAAVAALRRAVQLGWSDTWLAEHQPYFASLRARSDYREIIESTRTRNAATAAALHERLVTATASNY